MLSALVKAVSSVNDTQQHSITSTCERCSLYVSQYHCTQCQAYLCEGCNSLIHSLGLFSSHNCKKFSSSASISSGIAAYQYMDELEKCEHHQNQEIAYYAPSLNKFGCNVCFQNNSQLFKKINTPSSSTSQLNVSQKKQDIDKEMQTSLSYLTTIIERNNNFVTTELQNKKRELTQNINDVIERLIGALKIKQQDLLNQCHSLFQRKVEELTQKTSRIKKSKDTIERNYNAIKVLLNIIPENILKVEEPLIKKISQHNISILEDIQRHYGTKHQFPLFNVPQFSDDLVNRVDDAIRELNINKLQILTDTSGVQSYRSPQRDDFVHSALSTKQQNKFETKKSSTNIISQYQKFSAQKRDKSLNTSHSQNQQIMFKTSHHGNHPDQHRNKDLKEFISFDQNNSSGQAKNTSAQLVSAPLTALQSHRGGQIEENGNLRSDRHASQNVTSKGKSGKDSSFQKPTIGSTTNQSRKKGTVNQPAISSSKQRRTSCEQASPVFKGAQNNNAILNQSNLCSRDHSNNIRKPSTGNASIGINYNTMGLGQSVSQVASLQNTGLVNDINPEIIIQQQEEYQLKLDQNPQHKRLFTHIAQTSTAIQVAWSHPTNFSKTTQNNKQHLQYILQYGIGVKVNNTEQFRQIYKGKAHKCIITDLMPRTTYRFRVAPIIISEDPTKMEEEPNIEQGEWSEITNIATRDNQTFDIIGSHCATFLNKGNKKWMNFEKAGTMLSNYGYTFGEHLWVLKISYQPNSQSINNNPLQSISNTSTVPSDMGGIMVVGVINKRFSSSKLIGSVVNYSLMKGNLTVKILLDANKKRLIIYTPNNPQGEVFSDLPKDGLFYPAIQNKSKLLRNLLKVQYKFELNIPKDKNEIPIMSYSSSEENPDDEFNDDDDVLYSDRGENRKLSSYDEIHSEISSGRESETVSDLLVTTTYSQQRRDLNKANALKQPTVFKVLKKQKSNGGNQNDETLDLNIDKLLLTYGDLQHLLTDYDQRLLQVLHRHEEDFLSAYKTHMTKVEKELQYLKVKAKDQENRLASDERILRLEKQLNWFREELERLLKQTENNDHEVERLISKTSAMNEEKVFMQDQVKAAKRQNKLLVVALNKAQAQQNELSQESEEINFQVSETKKQAITVPSLMYSPFEYTSISQELMENYQSQGEKPSNNDVMIRESILASTEFPSEINTARLPQQQEQQENQNEDNENDEYNQVYSPTNEECPMSVVSQYVFELLESGRDEDEIVEGIEQYYNSLCVNSDNEMQVLQEELERAKAEARQMEAEEYVLPATEIDNLSNFFLECVYEQRKSLRHQLLTLKSSQGNANLQNSLLKIYMNTVKTGSQKEIEQFSHFEKQKLVQLLVTNQELLNYMFDKMFRNKTSSSQQVSSKSINASKHLIDGHMFKSDHNDSNLSQLKRNSFKQQPLAASELINQSKMMIKQNTNIFGMKKKSDLNMGHYQSERAQAPLKERKQRSMEEVEDIPMIPQNQTYNEAYFSASPLLAMQSNREQSNLRGQSGALLQKIKESNFNSNMLQHIDTDLHQQQYISQDNQNFNIQSPSTTQQQPQQQFFPDIYQKQNSQKEQQFTQACDQYSKLNTSQKRSRSSQIEKGSRSAKNKLRGHSTRPLMQIKNGKLLIVNR